jgi:hypothetical protein
LQSVVSYVTAGWSATHYAVLYPALHCALCTFDFGVVISHWCTWDCAATCTRRHIHVSTQCATPDTSSCSFRHRFVVHCTVPFFGAPMVGDVCLTHSAWPWPWFTAPSLCQRHCAQACCTGSSIGMHLPHAAVPHCATLPSTRHTGLSWQTCDVPASGKRVWLAGHAYPSCRNSSPCIIIGVDNDSFINSCMPASSMLPFQRVCSALHTFNHVVKGPHWEVALE